MKRIILTGGGTLGSVTPLIAIKKELESEAEFLWVGTHNGVELDFVQKGYGIKYKSISCGKLRRYFSLQNFIDPFKTIKGVFDSFKIIRSFRPDIVITAGSFVSVPLVFAAWIKRVPIVVHQLDLKVGLSNKIMAWFATKINVTFKENIKDFPQNKVIHLGSPVRQEVLKGDKDKACKLYDLKKEITTILIIGGGTGAAKLNEIVYESSEALSEFCQIIHLSGKGKKIEIKKTNKYKNKYIELEFLSSELPDVLDLVDIVVTRAGLGTITELIALKKPSIIIPIPNNQQEENAEILKKNKAAIILDQTKLTQEKFVKKVSQLIFDKESRKILSENISSLTPKNASEAFAKMVKDLI